MRFLILFSIVFILLSQTTFAQGNLQFNQAVIEVFTTASINPSISVTKTITVPAGKVWKIESASAVNTNSELTNSITFKVDGFVLQEDKTSNYSRPYPIWLPAGSHTLLLRHTLGTATVLSGSVSIIEFNIIP